jgi:hypothetical protein
MIDLRKTAARQWERNHDLQRRADALRRFIVAFGFGIAISTLAVLIIQTATQRAALPITIPLEQGLSHGE